VGLPTREAPGWWEKVRARLLGWCRLGGRQRSPYDTFMLRMHNYLKWNDDYQQNSDRCTWRFTPGSAWLVLTDTVPHAVLAGRYALEHSYFIAPDSLELPEESPAALLRQACGHDVLA
jgi:hypothetical protein